MCVSWWSVGGLSRGVRSWPPEVNPKSSFGVMRSVTHSRTHEQNQACTRGWSRESSGVQTAWAVFFPQTKRACHIPILAYSPFQFLFFLPHHVSSCFLFSPFHNPLSSPPEPLPSPFSFYIPVMFIFLKAIPSSIACFFSLEAHSSSDSLMNLTSLLLFLHSQLSFVCSSGFTQKLWVNKQWTRSWCSRPYFCFYNPLFFSPISHFLRYTWAFMGFAVAYQIVAALVTIPYFTGLLKAENAERPPIRMYPHKHAGEEASITWGELPWV